MTNYKVEGQLLILIQDIMQTLSAFTAAENVHVLPDSVKVVVHTTLESIERNVAGKLVDEFARTEFEFEEGDAVFNLLNHAVEVVYVSN